MHALVDRRAGDLRRGQPDPLVDDLHARVAGADGDLLGAVRVPVEPGLADQDLEPAAQRLADPRHLLAQLGHRGAGRRRGGLADAGRRPVGAERVAQRLRPLAGRHAGARRGDRRRHDVLVRCGHPGQVRERRLHGGVVAPLAPGHERLALLGLDGGVDHEDAAVLGQGRRLGLREAVHAHQHLLAGLDPGDPRPVGLDERRLHVRDRLDRAALLGDPVELRPGALHELGDEALHHDRALEQVGVLEQVGLVGQHLLDPQRPLLVPRPRQPERLVPGRKLDRAGACVAAERHRERLEHDPLHVVLGLGLGQPERVDLHAVAEAAGALVLHAVALAPELVPQRRHRAQLRVLLHEPHAGVDEERDAGEDARHVGLAHPRAHLVEDGDRRAQRVGDLLQGRGPGLLQVVGADVDGIPLRHVLDRVGHGVGDQPHRRAGREGVGPARQVLLDDVVLGRALEDRGVDAVLLRDDDVERQQPRRRRVDRHRRVHAVERDAVEQGVHVGLVRDRHADLPDLAARQLVVGVVARLGGQVEGDREPGLALGEVAAIQRVGLGRRRVARVRAHHPGPVGLGQAMAHRDRLSRIGYDSAPCERSTCATWAWRRSSAPGRSTA